MKITSLEAAPSTSIKHQDFFDTTPCKFWTCGWGNYCPCAVLQSLWLRCWGGCNRSCRHDSLLSCPPGGCNCFFVSCRKDTACLFLLNFAPWKKHMDKEDRDFALEFLHCTCSLASKKNCNTVESSIFGWSRMVPGNIFPLESVNKPISFDLDDLILVCRQQRLFESILTSEIQQTYMRSSTKTTHISTKLFYVSVLAETRRRMSNWRSLYIFSKDV